MQEQEGQARAPPVPRTETETAEGNDRIGTNQVNLRRTIVWRQENKWENFPSRPVR